MRIHVSALTLALLAALLCFDAMPGINWALWTVPAAGALLYFAREGRPVAVRAVAVPAALAALLSLDAALTADMRLHTLIALSCVVLLAVAARLAAGAPVAELGAGSIALSPLFAAATSVRESARRTGALARDGGAQRSLPVARGLVLAAPLVVILWFLLAAADPTLWRWGAAILEVLSDLSVLPRWIFGLAVGTLALGAFSLALRPAGRPTAFEVLPLPVVLGAIERQIILGAVVVLFALFVLFQGSAYFGDPAAVAGSGVTYAEWSHRGFGELLAAAALVSLLIVSLDALALRGAGPQESTIRRRALLLVGLTLLVVASAFRRVSLYEAAYGFTVARLWAQAFMVGVSIALTLLAWELRATLDRRRLARRVALAAAAMLVALISWNHESFIVRRNVERFADSGRLDPLYLATNLSLDALPALLDAAATLPPTESRLIRACLARTITPSKLRRFSHLHWYEWSLRRSRALTALRSSPPADAAACPPAAY